jgi:hypothetical protein
MAERVGIVPAIGDENAGSARRAALSAFTCVEANAAFKEQHGFGVFPHPRMKGCRFCTREDQGDAIAMFGQPPHPFIRFLAVRRIQPYAPMPRLTEPILVNGEMCRGHIPWPRLWRARVQIEWAQRPQNIGRRQPILFASGAIMGEADVERHLRGNRQMLPRSLIVPEPTHRPQRKA